MDKPHPTKPSCKLCQRQPGRCPTHDVDLSARNSKVNLAALRNDPEGFRAKCRRGYQTTLKKYGPDKVWQKLREYQLSHPSLPERTAIELFDQMKLHYDRIVSPWDSGHSVDFVIRSNGCLLSKPLAVEVNGHQWKPSFGEDSARAEKQQNKLDRLEADGYAVLVLDWREKESWPGQVERAVRELHSEELDF